jgi:translation initiation factor 2 subunit 2
MDYIELLKKAKTNLPAMDIKSRLEIPEAVVVLSKRTTIIKNFLEISKVIRREPEHFAKFIFKELACPGALKEGELILQGRIGRSLISSRIKEYIDEFVMCKECNRPDTNMQKDDRLIIIKCEACGAKRSLKS